MGEHHIHLPAALGEDPLGALLGLRAWLLVGKPRNAVLASPLGVDAVGSSDSDGGEPFDVVDLAIHCEEDVWEGVFRHDGATEALLFMVELGKRLRPSLVVAVDA